ncbi:MULTISPECIES: succinyl-diaminopimelate desuccinylase [Corynebacterium]|uniref:succinyl-diaminopimelate desuccinylase n=1 Tax=Corynebacterium TaxID=1716 RepID=UPI001CE48461|nr:MULTISPECIES: succinyl-diaminopimelate desuccinylase [Corynebacterium]MCG7446704.1 succinyl-diaminopimelate desuccinylase [Corynebacterium aurimucosum]MDK8454014.1 succinyl-diaminopimelate desuccinylase [Corynebacterium marquesiae]MDK8479651.1 succinyl-diaminopimelate desuccinylase [Corynebacterium marquesiae]MDK8670196.1 succinyl-diaminopimelate desuccinylase [Corynebacterium sp. MSK195]MDK8724131.1 succinyl-diaminopimelate desuccinylase [Corynebacterium marquesiae]
MTLDLYADPIELTKALVDIPSPSHHEEAIADAIEEALRGLDVEVARYGNTVCARTNRGLDSRVVLAGHIDTVPLAENVPHHMETSEDGVEIMWGCGTVDMKSGMAVYLNAFAQLHEADELKHDLTVIAYEGEEVATEFNGLGHLQKDHPEWLEGDFALLGEPSGAMVEAGCQGSIRLRVTAHGTRAHSARAWLGSNAAHKLAPIMSRIATYESRDVTIDGCTYREGLNIVHLESGVATNTLPDEAWMFVNFRFAPDRTSDEALDYMKSIIGEEEDVTIEIDDIAPAAQPGLGQPAAKALIDAVGGNVRAKYGWTDVARFSEMGTPAVNFGAGDPGFAHKKDEQVPTAQITEVSTALLNYLKG